jgi:hypothetical protein
MKLPKDLCGCPPSQNVNSNVSAQKKLAEKTIGKCVSTHNPMIGKVGNASIESNVCTERPLRSFAVNQLDV